MIGALGIVLGLAASAFPWGVVAVRHLGGRMGTTISIASGLMVLLWAGVVTALTGISLGVLVVAAAVLAFGSGLVGIARLSPSSRDPRSRSVLWEWLGATLGSAVWIITLVVAAVVPGAVRVGWVLAGDGFNNLDLANRLAAGEGIVDGTNPAPLPALLLAVLGAVDGSVFHGVEVMSVLWSVGIAASSMTIALIASSLLGSNRAVGRAIVAALASLLPLTVLFGTTSMYWGFLNIALVTPIVLASWIVLVASSQRPLAGVGGGLLLMGVAAAAWGPLAAVPAVAVVATVVRERRRLRQERGAAAVIVLVVLAQLGAFAAIVIVPGFFRNYSAFTIDGIGFPSFWPVLIFLAVAVATIGVLAYRAHPPILWALSAAGVGAIVAIAGTLVLAHGDALSYYPLKLAWFLTLVVVVILLALVVGLVGRAQIKGVVAVPVVAVLAAAAVLPLALPGAAPLRPAPVTLFTGGLWHGGRETERLVELVTRSGAPALLWRTGFADEGLVNYWALLAGGGYFDGDTQLRALAFEQYRAVRRGAEMPLEAAAKLCNPLQTIDRLTIYTSDPELGRQVSAACQLPNPPVRLVSNTREIRSVT